MGHFEPICSYKVCSYKKKCINKTQEHSQVQAQQNKNHSTGTIMSSASYSGTMGGTGQRPSTGGASLNPRGVVGSFDSLAKDGLNSTGNHGIT